MRLLEEIAGFPKSPRQLLESEYHITTAEAFVEHATRNPAGVRRALGIRAEEFERLVKLAQSQLPAAFLDRCQQPAKKHARGVVIDP